jgi:hypothetical protein
MKRLSHRQLEARIRGFAAINRVRRGESRTLSSAARTERTTVRTIRRLLPAALYRDRRGRRIRVKAADHYSQRVRIISDQGRIVVTAHGSRERELAGRHLSDVNRVLENLEPPSILETYLGRTVGSHELISDYEQLLGLVRRGALDQLENLYVSPGVGA